MKDNKRILLLSRLDEIGLSLSRYDHALALIGLGSLGMELDRLDEYSDLDFFVIVETGHKAEFIENLSWLSSISPIAYRFKNSIDGYKLLFEDEVFCEFAVFEEPELTHIPFAPGRIIWRQADVPDTICLPQQNGSQMEDRPIEWLVGEALTNLYVGLQRYRRGEKLSAMRFIQGYAVDRVLELSDRIEPATSATRDVFSPERRFEHRHPIIAHTLPEFTQGYERSMDSAKAILAFLEGHFDVDGTIKQAILDLCKKTGYLRTDQVIRA